jgi:hypothetical protein
MPPTYLNENKSLTDSIINCANVIYRDGFILGFLTGSLVTSSIFLFFRKN